MPTFISNGTNVGNVNSSGQSVNSQGMTVSQMVAAANAPSASQRGQQSGTAIPGVPNNYANDWMGNYNSQYNSMLNSQRDAIEGMYQSRVGQVNSAFTGQRQGVLDTGNRIQGSLQRTLGRAGGFTTTAGGMAQANQEQSVQNQITQLGQARDDALAQAMAAKQTGLSDVYEKSLSNMFQVQKQMADLQQAEQARIEDTRRYEESKATTLDNTNYNRSQDKINFETDLYMKGYEYVNTPSQRDALKAKGYQIMQAANGRTYAKAPEPVKGSSNGSNTIVNKAIEGMRSSAEKVKTGKANFQSEYNYWVGIVGPENKDIVETYLEGGFAQQDNGMSGAQFPGGVKQPTLQPWGLATPTGVVNANTNRSAGQPQNIDDKLKAQELINNNYKLINDYSSLGASNKDFIK